MKYMWLKNKKKKFEFGCNIIEEYMLKKKEKKIYFKIIGIKLG